MSASEGSRLEQEAAKTLAAAERALVRAQQLEARIKSGETTAAEVESRVQRAVARDRVAGETIGERTTKPSERAARSEADVRRATDQRAQALQKEEQAQVRVNRAREQGNAINRIAFQSRYGPYAATRNLEQQKGLLDDINRSRQRSYYGGQGPILPGGGRGVVPPAGGFPALGAGGPPSSRVGSSFAADSAMTTQARVAVSQYRTELSRLIQVQGGASQAMRRHGALTTEFIQAASRGEVTIRELGFQTAATIGKFGGWLGAGAAIYGVVGAMSALGRGALDAYSGVNQVQRVITEGVDPSKLRKDFRDLAGEFNLPIGTVTDAVYQMGKVFHDTDQAVAASRAVLYSVKVGELDVADATRYLIAIVNGFQLPATKMAQVFDQINTAQNKFGITIEDVEAGLAKASGQFRQSGGDVTHLIALITTAQKVTGNTGQVIGTALSRAPNFLRQAANQQSLREFGIKASTNVQDVIEQAFHISGKLSGARLQDLASTIFGPQYGARVGTALLANRPLYEEVLKKVQPDKAQGSAYKELHTALGGVNEQLQKILITLERVGSNLAEAGGFDLLFGLVHVLNSSLTAANSLLETFNELPEGLRHALSLLVQLSLAMRLLQRFQLGEAIAGGQGVQPGGARGAIAGVFSEGDRGVARRYRAGLFAEQRFLEDERAASTSRLAQAGFKAQVASEQYLASQNRIEQLSREGADGSGRMKTALVQQEAAERQMVSARQQVLDLEGQNVVATKRLDEVNRSLANTRRRFGLPGISTSGTIEEARRSGASQFFPTVLGTPTTTPPSTVAGARSAVQREAAGLERAAGGIVLPTNTEQTLARAQTEATAGAARSNRVASSFHGLGGALNRMLGGFGNMLFAAFAISFALDEIHSLVDSVQGELDSATVRADSLKQQADQLRTVSEQANKGSTFAETLQDFFTGSGGFHGPLESLLGVGGDQGAAELRRSVAAQEEANRALQSKVQDAARAAGKPVPFRYAGDIQKDIEGLKDRDISRRRANQLLAQYDDELGQSQERLGQAAGTPKEQQQRFKDAEAALRTARADSAGNASLAERIASLQSDELQKGLEAALTLTANTRGPSQRQAFERARIYYERINLNLRNSNNADDIASLDQAREKFYQGLEQTVQDELTRALLLARSPGDRAAAYSNAFTTLRQQLLRGPHSDLQDQQRQVQQLRDRLDREEQDRISFTIGLPATGGPAGPAGPLGGVQTRFNLGASKRDLDQLRQKIRAGSDNAKALRDFARESEREYRQIRAEIERQRYEEQAAVRQAQVDVRVARTGDPLQQARIQITFLNREIDRAIDEYGHGSSEVLQLVQQRQEEINQRLQSQLALIQAQAGLREARVNQQTDPVGYARTQISDLERQLSFMRAHAGRFDPAQIVQLEAQIAGAQVQLAETVRQQAIDTRNAAFAVASARAQAGGDDVRVAQVAIRQALFARQAAQTRAERLNALAQLIQARAQKRDSIYQSEVEDIQFQADIGKLTLDQQVRQYQHLLHTLNLTRDLRRDLRRKIYDLKQQSEQDSEGFDLKVGDIKLPTIYEIRRALKGGLGAPQVSVSQQNTFNIPVKNGEDAAKVGQQIDKAINGGAANAMRSAGLV